MSRLGRSVAVFVFPRRMTLLGKFLKFKGCGARFHEKQNYLHLLLRGYCSSGNDTASETKEEFRVLNFHPPPKVVKQAEREKFEKQKELEIGEDVDWSNIWVGPRSFDPYMVPIPVRQGYRKKGEPPEKYGNAELMKIPNFLHLTPVAIKKHCQALRKFCTEWPKTLANESEMEKHFPVTVISSDYCNSLPTIRDPLARIITVKVKLETFKFDKHARDKFLRLVGKRYDPNTDYVTITTENCPLKKQNYDYAMYLLTALYFESMKIENWESLKSDEDAEEYIFSKRQAKKNLDSYFAYNKMEVPDTTEIGKITELIMDTEESQDLVQSYKEAVLNLIKLPRFK